MNPKNRVDYVKLYVYKHWMCALRKLEKNLVWDLYSYYKKVT